MKKMKVNEERKGNGRELIVFLAYKKVHTTSVM